MTTHKSRIAPRPTPPGGLSKGAENFIEAAPDGSVKQAGSKGKKVRNVAISLTIPPDLLADVDEAASQLGISRAAFLSMASSEKVRAVLGK